VKAEKRYIKPNYIQSHCLANVLPLLVALTLVLPLSACVASAQGFAETERMAAGDPVRGWQALQDYGYAQYGRDRTGRAGHRHLSLHVAGR